VRLHDDSAWPIGASIQDGSRYIELRALSILFRESVLIYFMTTLLLIAAANIVNNIVLILCVLILLFSLPRILSARFSACF
jgi:hypothetical protein